MLDTHLRPTKDRILVRLCRHFPQWITPLRLTMTAFGCGLASSYAAAFSSRPSAALLLWIANRLLDGLDGSLARTREVASETGGFVDLLSDFFIYSLLPISVAFGKTYRQSHREVDWPSVAFLEATFHINNFVLLYVAIVEEKIRTRASPLTSLVMQPALVEGLESSVWFGLMLLFPDSLSLFSWTMGTAVLVGVIQRVVYVLPVLRQLDGTKQK